MPPDIDPRLRTILLERRTAVIDKVRAWREDVADEIEFLDKQLGFDSITPAQDPIDIIVNALYECGRPMKQTELKRIAEGRGFAAHRIAQSIYYQIREGNNGRLRIQRQENGLIELTAKEKKRIETEGGR